MSEKFLKNTWYMAGFSHEVEGGMLARKIIGTPVVFFRDGSGELKALHDRCPHRFAPLSKGELTDTGVQCKYHGLVFDGDGQCSGSILQPQVPKACRVHAFPVVERDQLIWLWPGDPSLADESLIVDTSIIDHERMTVVTGMLPIKANYLMLSDNLLDLTHATFLHPDFGGTAYRPEHSVAFEGNVVHSSYLVPNVKNPDTSGVLCSGTGNNVDQWDDVHWFPPGICVLDAGNVDTGRPREEGIGLPAVHFFTPETEHTTHYFWISGADKKFITDKSFIDELLHKAFATEDTPMIEAAYAAMEGKELFELNPVLLKYDSAAVRARRIMQQLISEEAEKKTAACLVSQ